MKRPKLFSKTSEQLEKTETTELWQVFVTETKDNLESCYKALTVRDGKPEKDDMDELFRALHTIKSGSAYMGASVIETLCHELESFVEGHREKDTLTVDPTLHDLLAEAFDTIHSCLEDHAYSTQKTLPEREESIIARLHAFEMPMPDAPESASSQPVANGDQSIVVSTLKQQISLIVHILKSARENALSDASLESLKRAFSTLYNSAMYIGDEQLELMIKEAEPLFNADLSSEQERSVFVSRMMSFILKLKGRFSSTLQNQTSQAASPETKDGPIENEEPVTELSDTQKKSANDMSIRVDEGQLGSIMNMVGELITARNAMHHLMPLLEKDSLSKELTLKELKSISKRLDQIADSMRMTVMSMRLVPVRFLYQRLGRLVRDLGRKTGKEVQLELEGEETEVDKAILDKLSEPLTHMIRNAIDHGIEATADRGRLGKSDKGTIRIKTRNSGSSIQIRVEDDGRGISAEFVREQAIRKGHISAADAEKLSVDQLIQLIFIPGFSTAEKISHISGRGIGMDAIKTVVEDIRGEIFVETTVNVGTSISIDVPVQASVIPALLIEIRDQIYAIPLDMVSETVKIKRSKLNPIGERFTFILRDKLIEIVDLHILFEGIKVLQDLALETVLNIVVVHGQGHQFGLAVDRICRREEILVKPLPSTVNPYQMFTGASILGDGQAVLIFDPDASTYAAGQGASSEAPAA